MSSGPDFSVWRIATRSATPAVPGMPVWEETDLSGLSAAQKGSRWNRAKEPLVYTASSAALACLETVVHLNPMGLPITRYLVEILIPNSVLKNAIRPGMNGEPDLPADWASIPSSGVAAQYGSQWIVSARSAVLVVPSVVVPTESNFLINPRHPDAAKIKAVSRGIFRYDNRVIDPKKRV